MSTRDPIVWHAHPTSAAQWPVHTAAVDFAQLIVEGPMDGRGMGMWSWNVSSIDGAFLGGGGTWSEADSKRRAEETVAAARARGTIARTGPGSFRPARLWARERGPASHPAVHALGPTASLHVEGKALCGMYQTRKRAYRGWEPLSADTAITCPRCRKALGNP